LPKPYSKDKLSIKTLNALAYRLNFPRKLIEKVAGSIGSYYVFWKKKKPNGEYRDLSKVKEPLRSIQQSIHKLLQEIRLPQAAHGGVKSRSNISNAAAHSKQKQLLNLDLKSYFPSISNNRVYGLFLHELDCSPQVASILTKLCTINGCVPQGAKTSTDIANLVFRTSDRRLGGFAKSRDLTYTRFVDDISFSGDNITQSEIDKIKAIIKDSGFMLNDAKESFLQHHENQTVTGLLVRYKKPRVPRKEKRKWRKAKHCYEKHDKHCMPQKDRETADERFAGWSNYVRMVEAWDAPDTAPS
jgi:hypothetical protein